MIADRRRILGSLAVLALVLLRLVIGWHFFGEGTKKLQYNVHDRQLRLAFSADDFLDKAKGPLANWYFAYMPDAHNWRQLLATPQQNVPPTADQLEKRAKWLHDYNARRAGGAKKQEKKDPAAPDVELSANKPAAVEFPPTAPYHDWATKIADDWQAAAQRVQAMGLSDSQKQQVDRTLNDRLEQLSDYLAHQDEAITAYRHELWRLANWRQSDEAKDVPYYQQRIAAKTVETNGPLKTWLADVKSLEADYFSDLDRILTPEQRSQPATTKAFSQALTEPNQARLEKLNVVVTILTIGVGACLLLGFMTRLASIAGAIFLLGVILSQPFWIADALPTMPYYIEFAGLLVLAATGAGRWLGLDFLTYAIFNRSRSRDVV